MEIIESCALFCNENGSDKEYHAQLQTADIEEGYIVVFQYGPRGGTLRGGAKTASPLPLDKAQKVYNKLVAEKTGKGYKAAGAASMQQAAPAGSVSPVLPQLLNTTESAGMAFNALIQSSDWMMEEKMDGTRLIVQVKDASVIGFNRKGKAVSLPNELADALKGYANCILDGELVRGVYYIFDLLGCLELTALQRYTKLATLLSKTSSPFVKLVKMALTPKDKAAMREEVMTRDGEGVVYKRVGSTYVSGRPASGGAQLKEKFYDTLSALVAAQNPSVRSVALALLDEHGPVSMGSVTIPPNYNVPEVGDVVEIRYLYAYRGGSLYQPIYQGKRSDIDQAECLVSQVKYKAVNSGEDDGEEEG